MLLKLHILHKKGLMIPKGVIRIRKSEKDKQCHDQKFEYQGVIRSSQSERINYAMTKTKWQTDKTMGRQNTIHKSLDWTTRIPFHNWWGVWTHHRSHWSFLLFHWEIIQNGEEYNFIKTDYQDLWLRNPSSVVNYTIAFCCKHLVISLHTLSVLWPGFPVNAMVKLASNQNKYEI